MASVAAAILEAAEVFSKYAALPNDQAATERRSQAIEFASKSAELRCSPPGQETARICKVIAEVLRTKDTNAKHWSELSKAFKAELQAAESAKLAWTDWR